MHEIFISYNHQSKTIADNIVSKLEQQKIRCWYAPRDVIGDYATSIVNAIDNSKIMVVILNEESSNSPHVLNEVEIAYKKVLNNDIIIIPFKADSKSISLAMEYYIKRLHWIDASNQSLAQAIKELVDKVRLLLGKNNDTNKNRMLRSNNEYYGNHSFEDSKEAKRLTIQSHIIKKFDQDVYNKVLNDYKNANVLDVGSNDGTAIMDRLENNPNVKQIVGIDFDENAIQRGIKKYQNSKIQFIRMELNEQTLKDELFEMFEIKNNLVFDVIVFSFILMHLKNQYQILKIISKYLKPNGTIIVSDVDDHIIHAYPDDKELFEKLFKIRDKSEFGGFRFNGRTIPSLLLKTGYKYISLEKIGLTPLGLNYEERLGFYDMCFTYIYEDTRLMVEKYPDNQDIKEDYAWILENKNDIEEEFMSDNFFYLDSTMIFIGKK